MTNRAQMMIPPVHIMVGTTLSLFVACALAADGPHLVGGNAPECHEALSIAEAGYRSNMPGLDGPPPIPPAVRSRLVLGFNQQDLSGGDALIVDDKVFDKHPNPDREVRSTYVQKTDQGGYRLAVREDDRGWRGDTYTVFALPETMSVAEATVLVSQRRFETLLSDQWRPPLVFQRESAGRLWFITFGQPNDVFGSWSTYAVADEGPKLLCMVEFIPPGSRVAFSLLPPVVRQFERLLDRTMGSGANEGELQPTARIKIEMEHTWGNVALRPWALEQPYNLRATVDAGLATWAEASEGNRRLLQDIRRQYPLATEALARYYEQHFGRSSADARMKAEYAIDIALRTHFVFHEERYEEADDQARPPNPWRAGS